MAGEVGEQGRTNCERCGTCCVKGGPALHAADLPLVRDRRLALGDLITIRLGEPVFSPLINGVEPSRAELIKVAGRNDSWSCRFLTRPAMTCAIYGQRPLECRLLQCWDPSALMGVIYRECLTRREIIPDDEEVAALLEIQEEHCSFHDIARLAGEFTESGDRKALSEIERVITLDLKIRQRAIQIQGLSIEEELLYFGRPLFKSLSHYRLTVREGFQGLRVIPAASLGT